MKITRSDHDDHERVIYEGSGGRFRITYVKVRLVEVEEAVVGGGFPRPEWEEDPE